jgi:hypothetical protein
LDHAVRVLDAAYREGVGPGQGLCRQDPL